MAMIQKKFVQRIIGTKKMDSKVAIMIERLIELDHEICTVAGISALLGWDQQTILPKKAHQDRGEHLAYISTLEHSKLCSDELYELLIKLKSTKGLDEITTARVAKLYRDVDIARKIPSSHIEEMARVSTDAFEAWTLAREKKSFALFAPHLEKLVALKRREAAYIDASRNPYEVLLDHYEEGLELKTVESMFSEIKKGLSPLISSITSSARYKTKKDLFKGMTFSASEQTKLSADLARSIFGKSGEDRVHIGESIHPFMTRLSFDDIRLTTAVRAHDPLFSFGSVAHECGHSLYELQIDSSLRHSVLCTGASMGLHESQSRFWENQICMSKPFWTTYFPRFQKSFGDLKKVSFDEFYLQINCVKPSLIRIESDEVTYSMHIIIRYEIERALMEGTLEVADAAARWNSLYKQYLGVSASHDTDGILQDVHWTDGSFGYFPTYTLGNVYSAMIFEAMSKEVVGIEKDIARGEFGRVRLWLGEHVHKHGSTLLAKDIVSSVCGKELDTAPYLGYLNGKFGELYGLKGK